MKNESVKEISKCPPEIFENIKKTVNGKTRYFVIYKRTGRIFDNDAGEGFRSFHKADAITRVGNWCAKNPEFTRDLIRTKRVFLDCYHNATVDADTLRTLLSEHQYKKVPFTTSEMQAFVEKKLIV